MLLRIRLWNNSQFFLESIGIVDVNLPTGVNLKEVSERLFFIEERVSLLNYIYCDLLSKGTQSEYFVQVLEFILG